MSREKEKQMEFEFKRDSDHRYLSIGKTGTQNSFQEKMLLKNTVPGLAKLSVRHMNGKSWYNYEARSRIVMTETFDGRAISSNEMKVILRSLSGVLKELERYLLRSEELILDPEGILWDLERQEPVFCYYPDLPEQGVNSFETLAEFLMEHADEKDEEATVLACRWFDRISDGVWDPSGVLQDEGGIHDGLHDLKSTECETEQNFIGTDFCTAFSEDDAEEEELIGTGSIDNYYLRDDNDKESVEKPDMNKNRIGIITCAALTVIAAAVYGFMLMNPSVASALNLSDRDYVRVGICVALIFSGAIIAAVTFISSRD